MIDQLEIDRTKNIIRVCYKSTPKGEVKIDAIGHPVLDIGNILIFRRYDPPERSYANWQFWLITEWHIHSDDLDIYYRPDLYDEQPKPPKRWLSAIDDYYQPLIDVFQDFRPKPKNYIEQSLHTDPRRAEIKARANPRYY